MRQRPIFPLVFTLLSAWCLSVAVCAIEPVDTVLRIKDVVIMGKERPRVIGYSGTQQTLNSISLNQLNVAQLGDVVKHLSGVSIKDYGGLGGIKTISVRSLGANHTAVSYDGMTLSNTQTGEIDLGRFSVETLSSVSLSMGLSSDLFLPANSFASSSLLSLTTQKPHFNEGRRINLKGQFKMGSFGYYQPSLSLQHKISDKISWSVDGDYTNIRGDFPFVMANGQESIRERREHAALQSGRGEVNFYGRWSPRNVTQLKAYYNESDRELPGSIILYQKSSGQELWDRTRFVRVSHTFTANESFRIKFNGHFSNNTSRYVDRYFLNNLGGLDNRYRQNESYVGAIASYMPSKHWEWVITSDLTYQTLLASLFKNDTPSRLSSFTVGTGRFSLKWVDLQAGVLQSVIRDRSAHSNVRQSHYRLSPFATLDLRLFDRRFGLRLFYKEHHRMPTFADLYYVDQWVRSLRPEIARQYNLSLNYTENRDRYYGTVALDLFYNQIKDKIVAMPAKNLYMWTMMNLGQVRIKGASLSGRFGYEFTQKEQINIDANYTFQQAQDVTDPGSRTYLHQIAYTPCHTGSASLGINTRWANLSYNALFSSSRYVLNQNNAANWLSGYVDQSVSLSRNFTLKAIRLGVKAECLNLFDQQYQVIRYYPMPGRNYRLQINIQY